MPWAVPWPLARRASRVKEGPWHGLQPIDSRPGVARSVSELMESTVKNVLRLALASAFAFGGGSATAQGIPVIDLANLVQSIIQVMDDSTQIANQVEQIAALQSQLNSMTGSRNLGAV